MFNYKVGAAYLTYGLRASKSFYSPNHNKWQFLLTGQIFWNNIVQKGKWILENEWAHTMGVDPHLYQLLLYYCIAVYYCIVI